METALGPVRPASQIELALSDAISLGIDAPIRMSGKTVGTPGCLVFGSEGHVLLEEGVIRAQRHVHMPPVVADRLGVSAGDGMELIIEHPTCPTTLRNVRVRVDPAFSYEVHIDTDEGNACDLPNATGVRLVRARG